MHLYQTLKKFLYDQDYFIDFFQNCIHVYGLVDIDTLKEDRIVLVLEKFTIEIKGSDFRVLKLSQQEILLQGVFREMRVI